MNTPPGSYEEFQHHKRESENIGPGGMSLRDWFAGILINGWAANGQITVQLGDGGPFDNLATWAYAAADAMLAARQRQ